MQDYWRHNNKQESKKTTKRKTNKVKNLTIQKKQARKSI